MTAKKETDQPEIAELNLVGFWKGIPHWIRMSLFFGPMGVIFTLVCIGIVIVFLDARTEMKGWFLVQKEVGVAQATAMDGIAATFKMLFEETAEGGREFKMFREDMRVNSKVVESGVQANNRLLTQTLSVLEMNQASGLVHQTQAAASNQKIIDELANANMLMEKVSANRDAAIDAQTKILVTIAESLKLKMP